MARKKKAPKAEPVEVRLPIPVLAFYEGVAAYAGLTVGQVLNVVLAIEMVKQGSRLTVGGDANG
jgi:hypothetical protein